MRCETTFPPCLGSLVSRSLAFFLSSSFSFSSPAAVHSTREVAIHNHEDRAHVSPLLALPVDPGLGWDLGRGQKGKAV